MPIARRLFALSLVVCALGAGSAAAQDAPDTTKNVTTIDIGDLWRMIRHRPAGDDDQKSGKRYLVIAPSIGSKPSTGLNGGFSGNVAFFAGDPARTRISTLSGGLKVSQKKQTLSGTRLALFTPGDRWFIMSENRMSWTSQATYALGSDAPASTLAGLKVNILRLYESAYRKVAPGLFVGAGIDISSHTNVRPGTSTSTTAWNNSAYLAYNQEHGFSSVDQRSSGTSIGLRYDTRDSGINASRGSLASASYRTFFAGFLGGDSTWQELFLDVRTYKKLTPDARQKIAFWFLGDLVTGGTAPFWDLPTVGADGRSARGYSEGRYRGERMLYWEAEYRGTLTRNGLLGMVLFANVATIDSRETGQQLFQSYAPAAGFGFRVLLNKRSHTNLCTDWAWGKAHSTGFYLAIQEAF